MTAAPDCTRCRDTGIVYVPLPSEFDRPGSAEWDCECRAKNDGLRAYTLALAAKRERGVRAGVLPPVDERERRQREEGPREWAGLDCARGVA